MAVIHEQGLFSPVIHWVMTPSSEKRHYLAGDRVANPLSRPIADCLPSLAMVLTFPPILRYRLIRFLGVRPVVTLADA